MPPYFDINHTMKTNIALNLWHQLTKTNIMKKAIYLSVCFLFIGITVWAQQVVTGKIVDNNNMPLAGVNIRSTKTGKGIVSAQNGTFRLQVGSDDQLEVSFVGYVTQ